MMVPGGITTWQDCDITVLSAVTSMVGRFGTNAVAGLPTNNTSTGIATTFQHDITALHSMGRYLPDARQNDATPTTHDD